MANVKAAGGHRYLQLIFGLPVNQGMQFALRDANEECTHFIVLTCNLKFNATIRQVAHPATYIKSFGYIAHRPAEPDALHVSLVENLERNHSRCRRRLAAF